MNFRHLKIFITVCEVGNMTRAAKELYMAQPSVSQAIIELEKYYGVRLFERLNHRLYLTAPGERLRSYAQHILNLSDQAEKELAGLSQGGSLRIGASLTIGAYLLPGLVANFHQQFPQVDLFTRVDNTNVIEQALLQDKLDLGLVEGPTVSAYIVEEFFCDDELVVIASAQHPLAKSETRSVEDLNGQAFIVREAGSGTQNIFEQAMREAGINWKIAGVYNNNQAIKQAVSANLGLAMVSKIAITEEVQQGKLVSLEVEGIRIKRKFSLVYHQQKTFTRAMQLFRDASKGYLGIAGGDLPDSGV
jgi:LysR family transcriptional regulator, transcriptional activator of the cysJI operon